MVRALTWAAANTDSVVCGAVYGAAVTSAVAGQLTAAAQVGLDPLTGILGAVFLEGFGLGAAKTSLKQRLCRERGTAARVVAWAAVACAATINLLSHQGKPWEAAVTCAASIGGMLMWEIRSAMKHRAELRKGRHLPEPPERYGWRRWLLHLPSTLRAWKLDTRYRLTPDARELVDQADREHDQRRAARARARHLARLAKARAKVRARRATASTDKAEAPAQEQPAGPPADQDGQDTPQDEKAKPEKPRRRKRTRKPPTGQTPPATPPAEQDDVPDNVRTFGQLTETGLRVLKAYELARDTDEELPPVPTVKVLKAVTGCKSKGIACDVVRHLKTEQSA